MKRWRGAIGSAQLAVLLAGLVLIALTWLGTLNALRTEASTAIAHANAEIANKTLLFETQIRRRLLAVDQTLSILEDEWERDPVSFDLSYWYRRARVLSDLALYVYITDPRGIITLSSRPELVGVDMSSQEAFRNRAAKATDDDVMFIGPGARDPITQQWQVSIARRLDTKTQRFAGIIGLAYNPAVGSFFNAAELGSRGMIALVGTWHGRIYASAGADIPEPGGNIAPSALYAAMQNAPDGFWTGPSAPGGRVRMHAFRRVVDRPLGIVLGVDPEQVLASHYAWQRGAIFFAAGTTLFLLFTMTLLIRELRAAQNREARLAQDRLRLERSNARQAAARELAEARTAQIDATLRGISDGVSMVDADMRLVQWNARFSEFCGVPADLLRVGLPFADALRAQAKLGEFGPVDVEAEVARRMGLLHTGSAMGVIERKRPNGRILEIRRRSLPTGGFVTLYADITERKRAEQALESAREIAEAAAADKSRVVAIVSHEIRTPLNALLNALTLLNSNDLSLGERGILGVARQSGDALLGLLDDILEMSRADAGQLTLRPASFALRPLLQGVLDMFQDQARARGISLRLDFSAGVPHSLYSDAGRLRQVLINLVSNAVKYSRPGPVVLDAAMLTEVGLTEVGRPEAGHTVLRLGLRDCGPAIDPADRPRLFLPFSRLEPHSSPFRAGTGLGLVICQRLTALLGGETGYLEAAADCNEFWISLPIQAAPAGERAGLAFASRRALPRTRVLLVDDSVANRTMIAELLRGEGHMVDVAENGEAAIAAVLHTPYDFVLMDIFMPGMNGLDATRALRGLGGISACVPIVALTANTGADELASCVAAGMNDMLSKPVGIATLLASMARYAWPGYPDPGLVGPEPIHREPPFSPPVSEQSEVLYEPRLTELRSSLAADTLAKLVEQCLRDIAVRMPALKSVVAAGQFAQIEAEAHAVAGMAASYAMAALEIRMRRLILAARSRDGAAARAASVGLDEDFLRTDAALRAIFSLVPV